MNKISDASILKRVDLLSSIQDDFQFFHLYPMEFKKNITIFFGENGVGKSTFLEVLALKLGCPAESGSRNFQYKTEDSHLDYTKHIKLSKTGQRCKDVFFYRSETFYNFITEMRNLDRDQSGGEKVNSYYGGKDLHTLSHGQAMKALYENRFKENSLYILDEPEASLSYNNQIALIQKILELSAKGTQFIISTHSPILMSIPAIDLIEINSLYYKRVVFQDTYIAYFYRNIFKDDSLMNNLLL